MSFRRIALVLAVATAVGVTVTSLVRPTSVQTQPKPVASGAPIEVGAPVGNIDQPAQEALFSRTLDVSGWALDRKGLRDVVARSAETAITATYGLARPDVASVKTEFAGAATSGFRIQHTFESPRPIRVPFDVVATSVDGAATTLGRRSLIPPEAMRLWEPWNTREGAAFHFLMATSGVAKGGAAEVDTLYRGYASTTQRIGIAVPILYLRTTRGRAGDWAFDPAFDTSRKCGDRPLADDSLNGVLAHAAENKLPLQVILNGGIWADANCNTPEWDLNDRLEEERVTASGRRTTRSSPTTI